MKHLILRFIQIQKEVFAENKISFLSGETVRKSLSRFPGLQGQVSIVIKVEEIQQCQDSYLSLKLDKLASRFKRHSNTSTHKHRDTHADNMTKYSLFLQ